MEIPIIFSLCLTIMKLKDRDHSIDIMKGFLIIGVVYYHMITILNGSCGIDHPFFHSLYYLSSLYKGFFMPAFFVVTGYCSSFDKPFIPFLISNVKGIIVPMISMNIISCLLSFNLTALEYMVTFDNWLWGLSFWFLPVLFLSKILSWPIFHFISNNWYRAIGCVLFFSVAVLLTKYDIFPDYWYWKSSLAFIFFIFIGIFLRNNSNLPILLNAGVIVYSLLMILVVLQKWSIPMIGYSVDCRLSQIPLLLLLATSGSLFIMQISRWFHSCRWLEEVGKASLVIYCSHWFIAQHLGKYCFLFFPLSGDLSAFVSYLWLTLITLFCSYIFYFVLNSYYLRWTLGKF